MHTIATNEILAWLMDGDPAIRWQTMRDLLDAPAQEWEVERQRTLQTGWGAQLLALQDANGSWGGGIYSPKWTSTTYTLLTLYEIGIPRSCAAAQRGVQLMLKEQLGESCDTAFHQNLARCDQCITGMILQLAVYFMIDDARIEAIVDHLLSEMMPDGAWNCRRWRRPQPHHSSFHTTFNVLDGLREYLERGDSAQRNDPRPADPSVRGAGITRGQARGIAAERRALEFMLQHRLFKSDHAGHIIDTKFTRLSFPHRWHYDVLRGLEYFARAGWSRDSRLQDAIDLLQAKRRKDGRWPVQQNIPAKCSSIWSKWAGRAAGIRYAHCGSCAGGMHNQRVGHSWPSTVVDDAVKLGFSSMWCFILRKY
jgi:hypothetical protein